MCDPALDVAVDLQLRADRQVTAVFGLGGDQVVLDAGHVDMGDGVRRHEEFVRAVDVRHPVSDHRQVGVQLLQER